MACGAPVAAMWCGGPEDIVQGGVTAFLVSRDDPMEMLTTVEQLLRDGGLRERMSQTEYKHIFRMFSAEVLGARILATHRQVYPDLFAE